LDGDLIIIVTDGIHDNLDPQHLGRVPKDMSKEFNLVGDKWDDVDPAKAIVAKNAYLTINDPLNKQRMNNETMNQWINETMNQWINESMNQWINESMNQWINESMNQWINESMNQWINESMNQW
jgi:flagellar biosynthesis/type III secretory pathway protein FliH